MFKYFSCKVTLLLLTLSMPLLAADIHIGVLAFNGKQQALSRWQPTADYLSQNISQHTFYITPLAHGEFEHAINKAKIDFVLTNPSHYVRLEVQFGATRMATFLAKDKQQVLNTFSAVMFVKADSGLTALADLKGKKFAAVKQGAFGGFQLAQYELLQHNINALKDMEMLWMGFPHMDLVKSVINGSADVATVRSGVLEKMAAVGELNLKDIYVIAQKEGSSFPYLRSFKLYPEWPIAKLPITDNNLARAVAVALLQMPKNDNAALQSLGAGWTIPLNYAMVHKVLKDINAPPYSYEPIRWQEIWLLYQHWIIAMTGLFLACVIFMMRFFQTSQRLKLTKNSLETHQLELEQIVSLRTKELEGINNNLQLEIEDHIRAEATIDQGCEVLHEIHTVLIRLDLSREQRLASMIDTLRHYLGYELALLSSKQEGIFIECSRSPINVSVDMPLSLELVQNALDSQSIYYCEDNEHWQQYIACPIYADGNLQCILELASRTKKQSSEQLDSKLSQKILFLIAQWLGTESLIMLNEKKEQLKIMNISERLKELTKREREVVGLLMLGQSNKAMAEHLNLSVKTVEMHRFHALKKTHSKSSTELVQIAVLSGEFNL